MTGNKKARLTKQVARSNKYHFFTRRVYHQHFQVSQSFWCQSRFRNQDIKNISCFPLIYFNFKQRIRDLGKVLETVWNKDVEHKINKFSKTITWWHGWHQNICKRPTVREHQPDHKLSLRHQCWISLIAWIVKNQLLVSVGKLITITNPCMCFSPRRKIFCKHEEKLLKISKSWRDNWWRPCS